MTDSKSDSVKRTHGVSVTPRTLAEKVSFTKVENFCTTVHKYDQVWCNVDLIKYESRQQHWLDTGPDRYLLFHLLRCRSPMQTYER